MILTPPIAYNEPIPSARAAKRTPLSIGGGFGIPATDIPLEKPINKPTAAIELRNNVSNHKMEILEKKSKKTFKINFTPKFAIFLFRFMIC
ncbi:hypothetical protein DERP_005625 [Dermatophagoides pteronyssinus]|uniref:Uncharacterized protein n=1 Tax=Dermatophagoides pteronyssinus TaxID=6956 RepID=A0ABQ8J959_DERPT|nr:hypothetical protein DERP_005625 [Dermatophagoides pteronyssinus]